MRFLFVMMFFVLGWQASAQEGVENWVRAALVCEGERDFIVEVSASAAIDAVILFPSDSNFSIVWIIEDARTRRFYLPKVNAWVEVWASVGGGGHHAESVIFEDAPPCPAVNDEAVSIPMNECLGIAPESLGLPERGVFTVDNLEYAYDGELSFLVPLDAIWHWDLLVDEQFVLSFEQNEAQACGVVE